MGGLPRRPRAIGITVRGRRVVLAAPVRILPATCMACSARGWFYKVGTPDPIEPPSRCSGVALCTCGTAEVETRLARIHKRRTDRHHRYYSRIGWRRRLVLTLTGGRRGGGTAPF